MLIEERRLRWSAAIAAYGVAWILMLAVHALGAPRVPLLPVFAAMVAATFFSGPLPALALLGVTLAGLGAYAGRNIGVLWSVGSARDWSLVAALFLAGLWGASWFARVLVLARQQQQRLNTALTVARMTSWEWDIATQRFTSSANARDVFGEVPTHVDDVWRLMHPDDVADTRARLQEALRTRTPYRNLARYGRPGGDVRWLETNAVVQWDDRGRPLRVAGVTMDVTERQLALQASREAEERLQKEAERKDAFLATLAHELRNPMAPIRYAVAMLEARDAPETRQRAREVIDRQAGHMSRLLDDLLDMSRISRNVIALKRGIVDLRDVVGQCVDSLRAGGGAGCNAIAVSVPGHPVPVDGDATRLQQVLGNLLDNAVKYSDPGAPVDLRMHVDGREVVLSVRDRGIGIAPDQQGEVFELFRQLGPGRGGLGIGLTVVKQLVELHGGSVAVRSGGLGQGSEFIVRLPLACAHEDALQHARSDEAIDGARQVGVAQGRTQAGTTQSGEVARHAGTPEHVGTPRTALVVDDNADATESLAMLMRELGFTVRTAYDGTEALRVFDAFRPALVLLDIGLPDMSGHDVARRLRQRGDFSSVLVAITGWGQAKDRAESAAAGFDLHLVKPVDPRELEEKVIALMRGTLTV